VCSLGHHHPFDQGGRDGVEPDGEEVARRIDDLDLLPDARPQRPGEMAGIGTGDGDAPPGRLSKK
jgi:hypothetical protein